MPLKLYRLKSKVLKYPGPRGWHFVDIDKKTSTRIKKRFSHIKRGWRSLPVLVQLSQSQWQTSIFPLKDYYLLAIKAAIRKKENIIEGDLVNFTIKIQDKKSNNG